MLVVDLDPEGLGQARFSSRRQLECTDARRTFEPSELQQTIQNPGADESLEVVTTLAPVETRLAEKPPGPRPQINAERGKKRSPEDVTSPPSSVSTMCPMATRASVTATPTWPAR